MTAHAGRKIRRARDRVKSDWHRCHSECGSFIIWIGAASLSGLDFKIDKGIPVPGSYASSFSRFPFADMQIGDSFFATHVSTSRLIMAARKFRPMRFTARTLVENGVRGVRIWRIE